MAILGKKLRGLESIRTLSGNENQVVHPHKAYMKIACLEMERSRRTEERKSAMARVGKIDARFNEIDTEKEALLESLAQEGHERPSVAPTPHCETKPAPKTHGRGFGIRY